mgnify:CR=1 FL=1
MSPVQPSPDRAPMPPRDTPCRIHKTPHDSMRDGIRDCTRDAGEIKTQNTRDK